MGKGVTIWFTGLPCSGKTTVADTVAEKLRKMGVDVERLDGDVVRKFLSKDLGFSKEDRRKNLERVAFVCHLLTKHGVSTLASFVSPYRDVRESVKKIVGKDFIEVFVKCSLKKCMERDTKGMYKKAIRGEIKDFTGIDDVYEEPEKPDIIVDTENESVEECAEKVIKKMKDEGYI